MEFLSDWKFWFAVTQISLTILILFIQWYSHQKIVHNDLKHLSEDVKQISDKQDVQGKEITSLREDIGYLKGKVEK